MKTKIYTQHEEHSEWLNKLSFYKDELKIMQEKLEEISSKNTGLDVRKSIEHFQNQFIIQKSNSDDIREHIQLDEKKIAENVKQNPVASDHRKTEDHAKERDMLESFESNFNLLRQEFKAFLADKM
ncbi:hypothetical protein [Aurantibacillus circumpalustris]|uniref:hypothetical protein n=1 Tax=Aurantibacillus circumpalustris TaxID=3036359 RepID=UPI00295B912C|nr:hypothetical protein [Aurantibacillus circumpalustris]